MLEKTTSQNRLVWADAVKAIAAIFVVVLHFNGYVEQYYQASNYSASMLFVYRFFEAYSFPAIHLFFLISAYFLVDSKFRVKPLLKLVFSTLFVTIIGLVVSLLVLQKYVTLERIIACIFPVTSSAYWFITSYAVLLLLAPVLNKAIHHMSTKQLRSTTVLMIILIVVIPSFLPVKQVFALGDGCIPVVITLYFVAATLKRMEISGGGGRWKWLLLSIVSALIMTASCYVINYASKYIGILEGHDMLLYKYNSLFVLVTGVSIFMAFKDLDIKRPMLKLSFARVSECTLFMYLIHMHPIIKECYTPLGLLSWVKVDNAFSYTVCMVFTVLLVAVSGYIVYFIGTKTSSLLLKKIYGNYRIAHVIERIEDAF